jgi:hypothetical protein
MSQAYCWEEVGAGGQAGSEEGYGGVGCGEGTTGQGSDHGGGLYVAADNGESLWCSTAGATFVHLCSPLMREQFLQLVQEDGHDVEL